MVFTSIALNTLKKGSPQMRKFFTKYPENKSYTITGSNKKSYEMVLKHIIACCKAGNVSPVSRYGFVEYGHIIHALNKLEIAHFTKNLYSRMEVMAARPLGSSVIGEVYAALDHEKGGWIRTLAFEGVANAWFTGRMSQAVMDRHYDGKVSDEFN